MNTFDPSEMPTVLVVEDEVLIREDAVEVLEREGFKALCAGTVSEAVAVLEGRQDIRAVFTDIQMPGDADGIDLARHVAERCPDVVVVITSGRSIGAPTDLSETTRFVPKPYMPRQIARLLREMLDDVSTAWNPGYGNASSSGSSPAAIG